MTPSSTCKSFIALALACCCGQALADEAAHREDIGRFHDIFRELVETDTTNSTGSCTVAATAMAARLKQAGYADAEMHLIVPPGGPTKGNLVVRLKGTGEKRPLLLLAHLDVVEARREDWTRDPFKLVEENGFYYGRGVIDDKSHAASHVNNLIRFKQERRLPRRDIIMALTCDEEIVPSPFDGVAYLLKEHRPLIDAELALNEAGFGELDRLGRPIDYGLQIGEKVFITYELEVTDPGGHSAWPTRDNAIYHLADGLGRLARFDFAIHLNETTRHYLEQIARLDGYKDQAADIHALLGTPPDAAALERLQADSSGINAMARTTCVATMLDAGHAPNALPQRARATVNCRILPGEPVADVYQTLVRVLADDRIKVRPTGTAVEAPQPPMSPAVMQAVQATVESMWPGTPVIPVMSVGATDGRFLNNAGIWTYGVGAFFGDEPTGVHGLNENIRTRSLDEFQEFLYRLTKRLAF